MEDALRFEQNVMRQLDKIITTDDHQVSIYFSFFFYYCKSLCFLCLTQLIVVYLIVGLREFIKFWVLISWQSSSSSCRAASTDIPEPSLPTSPYHSSPLANLQGYILYPHIAAVCMFDLVVLLLLGHMRGSIGVRHLWARPCFSSSVLRVWFI